MAMKTRSSAVAIAFLCACALFSQSTVPLHFESASVKANLRPIPLSSTGDVLLLGGGRLRTEAALLPFIIQQAYNLRRYQIIGGPDWMSEARYDIEAKAEGNATFPQIYLMLQSLLADRFKLKVHRETRQLPVYELTVTKGGNKLKQPIPGGCAAAEINSVPLPPPPPGTVAPPPCGRVFMGMFNGKASLEGGKVSVSELVRVLSNVMGRPVIDKTGISGNFDIHLPFAPDSSLEGLPGAGAPGGPALPVAADPSAGATIFTAIQEELGLKLESTKGPVEVIVIDGAERPTEN